MVLIVAMVVAVSTEVSLIFIELGATVISLALLARLASRWGFSAIPLYLVAGLAFGNGGLAPLPFSQGVIGFGAELGVLLLLFMLGLEYTGEELKTLICQTRMIFASSHAHRNNVGDGGFLPIAKQGVDFLIKHFWDDEHTGWFWTTERDGTPANRSKLCYGQSFAIYALSEYSMASRM